LRGASKAFIHSFFLPSIFIFRTVYTSTDLLQRDGRRGDFEVGFFALLVIVAITILQVLDEMNGIVAVPATWFNARNNRSIEQRAKQLTVRGGTPMWLEPYRSGRRLAHSCSPPCK
jgi:hypothetical protein